MPLTLVFPNWDTALDFETATQSPIICCLPEREGKAQAPASLVGRDPKMSRPFLFPHLIATTPSQEMHWEILVTVPAHGRALE